MDPEFAWVLTLLAILSFGHPSPVSAPWLSALAETASFLPLMHGAHQVCWTFHWLGNFWEEALSLSLCCFHHHIPTSQQSIWYLIHIQSIFAYEVKMFNVCNRNVCLLECLHYWPKSQSLTSVWFDWGSLYQQIRVRLIHFNHLNKFQISKHKFSLRYDLSQWTINLSIIELY